MKVEQLMTRPVWTCRSNDTLDVPAKLMWDYDVGCVVVLDADNLVGVITDRDICMGALTTGQPLWSIPVSQSMAARPFIVRADASIDAAERLMRENRVRRLPVVTAQGALVGLVSLNDLAREARRQMGKQGLDVSSEGVAGTLAVLCEPRRTESLAPKGA